ncbi:hypothetical protein Ndes2526B_g09671 [Nannochloris sp. 'desiccata']
MVVLCLGPVCVPLHLLLPFLLALAHQRGYFLFIKREWVTWQYWTNKLFGSRSKAKNDPPEAEPLQKCHTENKSLEDNGIAASPAGTSIEGGSSGPITRSIMKKFT